MHPRLNVTERERLRYSSRRLRALSALRTVGIEPRYSLYKEHRIPTTGRMGYRVGLLSGSDWYFERLCDIEAFAADYHLWKRMRTEGWGSTIPFHRWQSDPQQRRFGLLFAHLWAESDAPAPTYRVIQVPDQPPPCGWAGCQSAAAGVIEGQALCAIHINAYWDQRLAREAQRAGPG